MIVGIPKEIKPQENRVALVPPGARALAAAGHPVVIEAGAGANSGFGDDAYRAAGAAIAGSAEEVYSRADLIVKVKEPQPKETALLQSRHLLFCYLHLAAEPALTQGLMESGCTAIAYETVQAADGSLPLLVPMSQVAGRMSIQVGADVLLRHHGGRGVLLSGIPGVRPAKVVVLGAGIVGSNAAQIAVGLGADVSVLDVSARVLARLDEIYQGRLKTIVSSAHAVAEEVRDADLVIGAVLVTGAKAPRLVTRQMVATMQRGSVIVDVAIDQGGCVETSRPTTHADPTYVEEGVVHYCVTNMPGAVARTSTLGLTNATLPYVLRLADGGARVLTTDSGFASGLNIQGGKIRHPAVALALAREAAPSSR
jgi:alanine dehydrogenase